ncbi:MAG: TonB-dependent receptor plug domain-containing protein, partial [Bacteroidota bacterium]|nr:TonB-dependent receptor plug domain-containing protein [Bacteroidota bacterium]
MKHTLRYILFILFTVSHFTLAAQQQTDTLSIKKYSREMILNMSEEDLMDLSLENLMWLVKKLKVSSIEELYKIILNPVIETASKKEEQTFNSPLSVTVISQDELANSGVLNIPEALRLVPGMIIREKTNGNYDVHIRGNDNVPPGKYLFDSENTITLVMIDGRPVYNNFQGGIFWESLPIGIHDIEKIEVVIGPSSALYGPNAVSGVINIITKNPSQYKTTVSANVQYGNFGTKTANAAVNLGKYKHLSARISTNYQHRDRFQDEYLFFEDYKYHPSDSLENLIQYSDRRYPDTELALNTFGVNTYINGDFGKEIQFDLSAGTQQSKIQTIYLDLNNISLSTRESNTNYVDFRAKVKNLRTQISYDHGTQDNATGFYGYKFDVSNFNSKLEYDIKGEHLTISPGISFSKSIFD